MNGQCELTVSSFSQVISYNFFYIFSDDDPSEINPKQNRTEGSLPGPPVGPNPFLEIPQNIAAVEYKKGYVMRKCCYDSNNKKSE